ncbi:hypothetical protein EDB86DRAFT_2953611 [Lactarius hatsudake]|nr:hypothetical protein EDB86DRAFT_2953611 [Lactarius hatsudake]
MHPVFVLILFHGTLDCCHLRNGCMVLRLGFFKVPASRLAAISVLSLCYARMSTLSLALSRLTFSFHLLAFASCRIFWYLGPRLFIPLFRVLALAVALQIPPRCLMVSLPSRARPTAYLTFLGFRDSSFQGHLRRHAFEQVGVYRWSTHDHCNASLR